MKRFDALMVGLMFMVSCASTGQKTVEAPSGKEILPGGYYDRPGLQGEKTAVNRERLVAVFATVTAVDAPNRTVTLKDSTGDVVDLRVGDQVRNLDQVNVGDKVMARYYTALAIRVMKEEKKKSASAEEPEARAESGERPAGIVATETTLTAEVTGIDKDASTVVLQDPDRDIHTMEVRDPKSLEDVNVGDHVTITYIGAVAISVEKP